MRTKEQVSAVQFLALLEQQFADPGYPKVFSVSEGFAMRIEERDGDWKLLGASLDGQQNIFSITNITANEKALPLHDIHAQTDVAQKDLISGLVYENSNHQITFAPYQTVWLSGQ